MTNISELTTNQLHKIIAIKERIEKLQGELDTLVASNGNHALSAPAGKRTMSAAARAKIAAASTARWAKAKGSAPAEKISKKKDRRMSPAVKARLAEIARARWAKVKAAGKSTL